jgi:hypothetical protein
VMTVVWNQGGCSYCVGYVNCKIAVCVCGVIRKMCVLRCGELPLVSCRPPQYLSPSNHYYGEDYVLCSQRPTPLPSNCLLFE